MDQDHRGSGEGVTPRERVIAAMDHLQLDAVPYDVTFTRDIVARLESLETSKKGEAAGGKSNLQGVEGLHRVSNTLVDLVVLGEAGPRIIRFGFVGEENAFREFPDLLERGDSGAWHVYGGHRLWHAPEHLLRTYSRDNSPVEVRDCGDSVRTIQPVEKSTGIRKEMDIRACFLKDDWK